MSQRKQKLETGKEDDYLPFENRDTTHATSDFGALMHMVKSSLGSGILAMPNAFKNGGLILGTIGTIIIGLICTHCIHLLVKCSYIMSVKVKKPTLSFAETAEAAFLHGPERFKKFASFARILVTYGLLATYYLGNTVYVIFISTSLQQVINNHYKTEWDIRIFILFVLIPLIPLGLIRPLKYLVPFSATATLLITFGLVTILYFIFSHPLPINNRTYVGQPQNIPIFLSTVLFAMEGIGAILPIENSMKNPRHFTSCPGVLNFGMFFVVSLYTIVGFFGYLSFGEKTGPSVTYNLGDMKDSSPGNKWIPETVEIVVAVSILFTYGLQFTVPTEIIWKKLSPRISENKQIFGHYLMRFIMVVGTGVIAMILPNLGPFISLMGAIFFSTLGLTVPCVVDLITSYEKGYGFMKWILIKNSVIILISIVALVAGTYSSILDIIKAYSPKSSS